MTDRGQLSPMLPPYWVLAAILIIGTLGLLIVVELAQTGVAP